MRMSKTVAEVRTLKVNRYIIIDDEPCKIVEYSTSKPGKHGEAKARLVAIGIFDNQKRSIVHPVTHKVHVPMINKGTAQVISLADEEAQLMDMDTYEMFTVAIPEAFKDKIEAGETVQYLEALGKKLITRA